MSACRVMVVTEDPILRKVFTGLLEGSGFEAFPASDGVDALRQIYHVAPQVLISEAELCPYAGFELLPFVRRRFPEIGVVAVLRENHERRTDPDEIVADAIVPIEPFNPTLLAETLADVTARYPFRQDGERIASNLTSQQKRRRSLQVPGIHLAKAASSLN